MKSDTERVLYIVVIVVSLLCGAYIGHENTLDYLHAQPQQEQCTTTDR
jgi:uncharacterized protein YneF (UPF0154 family)